MRLESVGHHGVVWDALSLAQVSPLLRHVVLEDRHEGGDGDLHEDEAVHEDGEPYVGEHVEVGEADGEVETEDDGEQRDVGDGHPGR